MLLFLSYTGCRWFGHMCKGPLCGATLEVRFVQHKMGWLTATTFPSSFPWLLDRLMTGTANRFLVVVFIARSTPL